jgi:hypothetical protein
MNKYAKLLFLVFVGPQTMVQFAYLGPTTDIREKMVGAESVNVQPRFSCNIDTHLYEFVTEM